MKTKLSITMVICIALSCILQSSAFAQNVAINTTGNAPSTSAGLDVDFTNRGVLIPRIALTNKKDLSTITGGTPANSLLIYNTATAGTQPYTVFPGYYYFLDSVWVRLADRAGTVILTTDRTNNNATANTLQDVTGLSFPVASGVTYRFKFFIVYTSATTANGSRWSINGPASPTNLNFHTNLSLTTTSRSFYEGLTAYNTPSSFNATSASTTSNIAEIEGIITPSANGTVIARFASETANTAVVAKANLSYVQWEILK